MGWESWNSSTVAAQLRDERANLDQIFGAEPYEIDDCGNISTSLLEVGFSMDPRDGCLTVLIRATSLSGRFGEQQALLHWLRYFGKEEEEQRADFGELRDVQVRDALKRLSALPLALLHDPSTLREAAVFTAGYVRGVNDYIERKGWWTPDPLEDIYPYLRKD